MTNVIKFFKRIYDMIKKKPQIHIDVNAVNSNIIIIIHKD